VAMSERPTLLRMLVGQRHWQKYEIFRRQYENAANHLATEDNDPRLRGLSIAKRQFERWLGGKLKTRPYPDHCRVLEYLFGRSIDELLAPVAQKPVPGALPTRQHGLPTGEPTVSSVSRVMRVPSPAPAIAAGSPLPRDASRGYPDFRHGVVGRRSRDPLEPYAEEITRELTMTAHESSEHAGFVASRRLEPVTLEQLHDNVIQIARQYAHTPPLYVYGDAKRVRNRGFELLEWTRRAEQEDDLYLLIGQACGLLASVSFDLGNRDAATEQACSAWIYGKHIGHHGLCAWARGMQALIAYWSGRPLEALRLVRETQDYAPPGTPLVRLRCIEARAWAHLGDLTETTRAIQAAQDAREHARERDDLHDGIAGEFGFDQARQARCNGSAYLDLGAAEPAIAETRRAIDLFAALPPEHRWFKVEVQAHTDLSAAHLLDSELDGARDALVPVFAVPPELRVEGLTQRLGRVRALLARSPVGRSQEARQLGEHIEDFVANAAGRMLPSSSSNLASS
jgi:tetratricopeptide (TPR) repeat protein